jgi:hypothetical protein
MIFISRTVLEVPEDLPLEPGTHASPRAHRRRGHKRRVAYGVGRAERRWQWFPAVWVNGDPPDNWQPTTYEVASRANQMTCSAPDQDGAKEQFHLGARARVDNPHSGAHE